MIFVVLLQQIFFLVRLVLDVMHDMSVVHQLPPWATPSVLLHAVRLESSRPAPSPIQTFCIRDLRKNGSNFLVGLGGGGLGARLSATQ